MGKNRKIMDLKDGEWAYMKTRGQIVRCCDCGLIHKMDFLAVTQSDGHILNEVEILVRAYRVEKPKKNKGVK